MPKVTLENWQCALCGKRHPESEPYFQVRNGNKYFRHTCKSCDNAGRLKYRKQKNSPAYTAQYAAKQKEFAKNATPDQRAALIIKSSTAADRPKGRETRLTVELVASMVSQPCSYCGDNRARMTLDRIDNTIGHVPGNIAPCCFRCNIVRGAMPYQAWLLISQNMRQARELGLFGEWDGSTGGNAKAPLSNVA